MGLSVVSSISWIVTAFAQSGLIVYISRGVLGYVAATSSLASSVYVGEISSKKYRGTLGSILLLFVAIGISASMFLGAVMDWRLLSGVGAVPQILGTILLVMVPESPYYLQKNLKFEEAKNSLYWLLINEEDVNKTLVDIDEYLKKQHHTNGDSNMKDNKKWTKLLMMSTLMAFSRLCGVTQISYYMVNILQSSRISVDVNLAAAVISLFEIVGCTLSVILSDRAGRKVLLILSGLGMGLGQLLLRWSFINSENVTTLSYLESLVPVVAMSFFYVMFTLGLGSVPFVILGEIFSADNKGTAVSISVSFIWLLNFLTTKTFYWLTELVGFDGTFLFYAACCFTSSLFTVLFVPETKNKTLAQIQETFESTKVCVYEKECLKCIKA